MNVKNDGLLRLGNAPRGHKKRARPTPVCTNHDANSSTHIPGIFALLALLISASTANAGERGREPLSSMPGYAVFPSPHIYPGIAEGVSLIGGTINIEGAATGAYAILFGSRVNSLTIGMADLHLTPKTLGLNNSDTLYGSVGWQGERDTNYQTVISYRGVGSEENPFLTAKTYTLGIAADEVKEDGREISYGYTLTRYQNTRRQGNDYAHIGHRVNAIIDKPLGAHWSSYLSGNVNLFLYSNPDSYTRFQKRRVNSGLGLGGGVSYHYSAGLSLFAGYDFYIQHSNLPLGFIYNQFGIIEGIQSTSLGSYASNSVNLGVRYNF